MMYGWLKGLLIGVISLSQISTAYATMGSDETAIETNSSIAQSIQGLLVPEVLSNELSGFAYSIYLQGRKSNGAINEQVSNSPYNDWASNHGQYYCSTQIGVEQTAFSCNASSSAGDEPFLELGDTKTSTILGPIVYSPLTQVAAQDTIRTIVSPYPSSKYKNYLNSTYLQSSNNAKDYVKYMANQAALGPAMYSLNQMYAIRSSTAMLGVSGANACPASCYNNTGTGANACPSGCASLLSTMENEATRRYLSSDWLNGINNSAVTSNAATGTLLIMQEMVAMQSFQMYMEYQRFRQGERIEALLSALLAKTVNTSIMQDQMTSAIANR